MIAHLYSGVVCEESATNSSHTDTSISNMYKYSFRSFCQDVFQNGIFSVSKTNVLGPDGIAFTNKSLFFHTTHASTLTTFVPVLLGLYSLFYELEYSCIVI